MLLCYTEELRFPPTSVNEWFPTIFFWNLHALFSVTAEAVKYERTPVEVGVSWRGGSIWTNILSIKGHTCIYWPQLVPYGIEISAIGSYTVITHASDKHTEFRSPRPLLRKHRAVKTCSISIIIIVRLVQCWTLPFPRACSKIVYSVLDD